MKSKLRSRWPLLFSIILFFSVAIYFVSPQFIDLPDRELVILAYGILGFACILFLTFYFARKNTYRYQLGSTHSWLQAHIYIGILSLILVLLHSDFTFEGIFSIFLFILFLLVIISGILGSLIYTNIPLSLTKYGRDTKPRDEIIRDIDNHLNEADKLVFNTSKECKEMYQKKIRPIFQSKRTKWQYIFMEEKELLDKRRKGIEQCKSLASAQDIYEINILSSLLIEKEKLSFMLAKINLQSIWLNVHLPITTAMLAAVIIHVWSIIYF
jgi:cytochrome b561